MMEMPEGLREKHFINRRWYSLTKRKIRIPHGKWTKLIPVLSTVR